MSEYPGDNEFMTYDDIMRELENDRDDTYDPEFRMEQDYCEHGTYIGPPSGADFLCGWCESGISVKEMNEILAAQRLAVIRRQASNAERLINELLKMGYSGIDTAYLAQRTSNINNPPSRYGRHGWR